MVPCMVCSFSSSRRSRLRVRLRHLYNFAILGIHQLFAIQARLLSLLGLNRPSMHIRESVSVKTSIF